MSVICAISRRKGKLISVEELVSSDSEFRGSTLASNTFSVTPGIINNISFLRLE